MFARLAVIALACVALQGCFFAVIPGSTVGSISDAITGQHGNMCIDREAKVGDKVLLPGRRHVVGTIQKIDGPSATRCPNSEVPIRAEVTEDVQTAPQPKAAEPSKLAPRAPAIPQTESI